MDDKRILSDDEFAQLMEAQYDAAGQPLDELARERVKQAIHRRLSPSKRRRLFYGQVGAIAAVLVVAVTYFVTREAEDLTRPKGDESLVPVNLALFTLEDDGSLRFVEEAVPVGATVVVKVNPPAEVFGALIVLEPGQAPRVELAGKLYRAGEEVVLGEENDVFGYRFSQAGSVDFCFVAATDTHQLRLSTMEITPQVLQHARCQTVVAQAGAPDIPEGTP